MLRRVPSRRRHALRRLVFIGFALVLLIGVAIQLVPYGRNHTNPPVRSEPAWNSVQTQALFVRACADCHSNQTVWPWYSNIAPLSWGITRDVQEARDKFNISRSDDKGDKAAKMLQRGDMPPFRYLIAHSAARLSPDERQALIKGLDATFGSDASEHDED